MTATAGTSPAVKARMAGMAPLSALRPYGHPSVPPAADPPEAEPGQGQGEGEVDRGLSPLQGPVAAGGLIGDGHPDAMAGQARQRIVVLDASGRHDADRMPRRVDGSARVDPGSGLAAHVVDGQRKAAAGGYRLP